MIDGLSCDNCPDKKRCKEQQEKKNNIIKNILADIVDKAKICGCDIKKEAEILLQQIPDVTRCDVVLEKQLKQKEQEYTILANKYNALKAMQKLWNEAEYDRKKYKKCLDYIKDELETSSHCESEECGCDDDSECLKCTIKLILKKINEVENGINNYSK